MGLCGCLQPYPERSFDAEAPARKKYRRCVDNTTVGQRRGSCYWSCRDIAVRLTSYLFFNAKPRSAQKSVHRWRIWHLRRNVQQKYFGTPYNFCAQGRLHSILMFYIKAWLSFQISTTLSQFLESPKTASENAQKVVYEFADNIITTLWCLS